MNTIVLFLLLAGQLDIKDWDGHNWSVGDRGVTTRMVNAPTTPKHIDKFMKVSSTVTGVAQNTADMLDSGALLKVRRGSTVSLVQLKNDKDQRHPYVECTVEQDGKRSKVYLVLEKSREGQLTFVRANDPIMDPQTRADSAVRKGSDTADGPVNVGERYIYGIVDDEGRVRKEASTEATARNFGATVLATPDRENVTDLIALVNENERLNALEHRENTFINSVGLNLAMKDRRKAQPLIDGAVLVVREVGPTEKLKINDLRPEKGEDRWKQMYAQCDVTQGLGTGRKTTSLYVPLVYFLGAEYKLVRN